MMLIMREPGGGGGAVCNPGGNRGTQVKKPFEQKPHSGAQDLPKKILCAGGVFLGSRCRV